MKRQTKRKSVFFSLFLLFITILPGMLFPIRAQASTRTIRVGIFELNGFYEKGENGQPQGYGPDYLSKLSEKTSWKYEYVWTENWDECIQALRDGKIDLIAPAGKTEDRMAEFGFSGFSIGTECGALLTLSTNDNLIYEDFQAFHHMKVGCVDSLIFKQPFLDYASTHGFTPDMVTYKDTKALMAALHAGEVDAVLANLFVKTDTTKILAKCGAEPFYFMTSKENHSLIQELDEGLQRIKIEDTTFETALTIKYWPSFHETPFTKAELEYIVEAPALSVGCRTDFRPVSYLDSDTGEMSGITISILEEISRISGLRFEYTTLPGGSITYDYLRDRNIKLIANVEYNSLNLKSSGINPTIPYLHSKKVFVCNQEDLFDTDQPLKLAISTGSQTLAKVINNVYPNFEVVNYDSIIDCFYAVQRHEADALLQNQYVVTSYLNKPLFSQMTTIPVEGLDDNLCLSPVIYQERGTEDSLLSDERLISILNKAIRLIEQQDINKMIIRNTSTNLYKYTVTDFLYQYRYFLTLTAFILSVIVFLLLRGTAMKRKTMKLIAKNEAKLRHITNNINGGVVVLAGGDKLVITYANEGFLELLQYPKDDYSRIKNQEYTTYVHPEHVQALSELMTKDISQDNQVSVKLRIMRRDEVYIPVLFNGTITINDQGEREIYCVIMDISEQEMLLNTISLEQRKYRMLIENSGDIIFELDYIDRTLMISPLFEKQFGWKIPEDPHYENKYNIIHNLRLLQEDWDVLHNSITSCYQEQQAKECNVRIQKKDDDSRWCHITMYPMLDNDGNVVYLLGKILDIHEETLERQALEQRSRTDELTGLLNKNAFFEEAEKFLYHAKGNTALVFLDVDNFKQINDTLGHMTGDQVIKDTAKKLQIIFSNYDILARFGGDEFCILLKEIPEATLVDKLSWAVEKLRVTYQEGELSVNISSSIGAANTHGQKIKLDELLANADKALYHSKENGKDQFFVYYEGM